MLNLILLTVTVPSIVEMLQRITHFEHEREPPPSSPLPTTTVLERVTRSCGVFYLMGAELIKRVWKEVVGVRAVVIEKMREFVEAVNENPRRVY